MSRVHGLPTELRLAIGAALCVLPLGLTWSTDHGFRAGHATGAQVNARVLLVLGALALGCAAARRRTPATQRLVRVATGTIGIAFALAVSERAVLAVICLAFALALVVPPAWRRRPYPGVSAGR